MSQSNGKALAVAPTAPGAPAEAAMIEKVLIGGDLSALSAPERLSYYRSVCESLGLNPLTRPFAYLKLSGGLVLYAKKDATDQLRNVHGVSIINLDTRYADDLIIVTATAKDKSGRVDTDLGAVNLKGIQGEARANAIKKAVTQAKRRVTLSICGLGMLDESELEAIPGAQVVVEDEALAAPAAAAPAPSTSVVEESKAALAALRAEAAAYQIAIPAGRGDFNKFARSYGVKEIASWAELTPGYIGALRDGIRARVARPVTGAPVGLVATPQKAGEAGSERAPAEADDTLEAAYSRRIAACDDVRELEHLAGAVISDFEQGLLDEPAYTRLSQQIDAREENADAGRLRLTGTAEVAE